MKTQLFSCFLATALLAGGIIHAQTPTATTTQTSAPASTPSEEKPEIIEQNGQKFVLISTIKTIEANREFQNNVNVVQTQRNIAIELKKRIDQALTTPEKEALQQKLDEVVKKLDENNKLMAKTYGFSLTRNYLIQVLKTRLYSPLSDEEYSKLPEAEKNKPDQIVTQEVKDKDGKSQTIRLLYIAAINGAAENNIFRQNVQLVQTQRQRVLQLAQAIEQIKNDEEKKTLEEELKKSEETLQKNNDEMIKRYGFSLTRNYVMEIEESRLYTALSEEELKKAQEAGSDTAPIAPGATSILP